MFVFLLDVYFLSKIITTFLSQLKFEKSLQTFGKHSICRENKDCSLKAKIINSFQDTQAVLFWLPSLKIRQLYVL